MPENPNIPMHNRDFIHRAPARYFPLEKGLYEVAPGLRPWGTDLGNGSADSHVFQLDREFPRYRENKQRCRAENLKKYFLTHDFSPELEQAVSRWMVGRLTQEHPELFLFSDGTLECRLTDEKLHFEADFTLKNTNSPHPYKSALDALAMQVQEDIAIMRLREDGSDLLTAIHLCSPNHWGASEKIGRDFIAIHKPVAGIEKINASARSLTQAMVTRGPYVRFAWGIATDNRLNHHPDAPPGISPHDWQGRSFEAASGLAPGEPPLYVRFERQVLWGIPDQRAFVFTIRSYFLDGAAIKSSPGERALLRSALLSMTPESLAYKGLTDSLPAILSWLEQVE